MDHSMHMLTKRLNELGALEHEGQGRPLHHGCKTRMDHSMPMLAKRLNELVALEREGQGHPLHHGLQNGHGVIHSHAHRGSKRVCRS